MKLNTISFPRATHEARNPKPERFRLHRKLSQACDEIKLNHQMETKERATLLNFSRTSLAVFLVLVLVQLESQFDFLYYFNIHNNILIIFLFHIYVSFFICTSNIMCIILISLTSHLTFTFF